MNTGCPFALPKVANGIMCPDLKPLTILRTPLPFFQFIMGFESTYQWEDPIYSGVVFGSVLSTLVAICYYSLISVFAYASLTILCAVIGIQIYTYVMVTFLKKETTNPIAKIAGKQTKPCLILLEKRAKIKPSLGSTPE